MFTWTVIGLILGLLLGLLIGWLYWRWQLNKHEAEIRGLQTSADKKDQRLQSAELLLQDQEANAEQLQASLSQSQAKLRDQTAQMIGQDELINRLSKELKEREAEVQDLKWRTEAAEATARGLAASFEPEESEGEKEINHG
jgi:chromosome segregation ATPase